MTFDVIATGSAGNAVTINGSILIDCGISYKRLRPRVENVVLCLLTHEHGDHFQPSTVHALHKERPAIRWGCCEWMVPLLLDAGVDKRAIDVLQPDVVFWYPLSTGGIMSVEPVQVVHNVPNCGFKIFAGGERVFYATDTGTLDGIEAKGFDYYLIEANHTREELDKRIREKMAAGEYAYEIEAARNHLSQEQAFDWLAEQMSPTSRYIFLHQHTDRQPNGQKGQHNG